QNGTGSLSATTSPRVVLHRPTLALGFDVLGIPEAFQRLLNLGLGHLGGPLDFLAGHPGVGLEGVHDLHRHSFDLVSSPPNPFPRLSLSHGPNGLRSHLGSPRSSLGSGNLGSSPGSGSNPPGA